jgi:hypothetical protein
MGIPGNGRLRRGGPAESYTAMTARARSDGVDMKLWESSMRRTYRELAAQIQARNFWCGQGRCGNAAVPGTSNHGWGINVDLMSMAQRSWIDRHGSTYGWSKRWSDAANEWWHITYQSGHWNGHTVPTGPRILKRGVRPGDDVKELQKLLRQAGHWPQKRKVGRKFGPNTVRAVKRFQRKHKLKADGVVGPKTMRALKRAARRSH